VITEEKTPGLRTDNMGGKSLREKLSRPSSSSQGYTKVGRRESEGSKRDHRNLPRRKRGEAREAASKRGVLVRFTENRSNARCGWEGGSGGTRVRVYQHLD